MFVSKERLVKAIQEALYGKEETVSGLKRELEELKVSQ